MRPIVTILILLAVAVLSVAAPALAAGDFELRILEGPFTVAPTGALITPPTISATGNPSSNPAGAVRVLDDRGVR